MNFENVSVVDIQVHLKRIKKIFRTKSKTENSDWPDIIFRYYKDTDDLGIYFIEVTPSVLDISDNALDDLLVSYDHNRKIISIDLDEISRLFHSNMFTVDGLLNRKFIKPIYDEDSDTLKINFVNINPLPTKIQKTTINDIEVEMDTAKKLITILFYNASKNIAKPLSEEEIKFFAEKVEQERMENSKLFLRLKLIEQKVIFNKGKKLAQQFHCKVFTTYFLNILSSNFTFSSVMYHKLSPT